VCVCVCGSAIAARNDTACNRRSHHKQTRHITSISYVTL